MKEEIKENVEPTLEYLKMCVEDDVCFETTNCKALLDYITKLENKIHSLEKYNHKLNLEAQKYFDLLVEESSKVSRAIEYINYFGTTPEQNDDTTCRSILKSLLNILQGDKE